jgi:ABC-type multidrug transport system fused ATPase/permease subunit
MLIRTTFQFRLTASRGSAILLAAMATAFASAFASTFASTIASMVTTAIASMASIASVATSIVSSIASIVVAFVATVVGDCATSTIITSIGVLVVLVFFALWLLRGWSARGCTAMA